MNTKYLTALTTIVLATGLDPSATNAQQLTQVIHPKTMQLNSLLGSNLGTDIEREGSMNSLLLPRERTVIVSRKADPPPPRPSPPGGSR